MNLSPQFLAWLGVMLLVCTLFGQALKTDALDAVLAKFNLPPVPKRAVPWLTLLFGFLVSFLGALIQKSGDWQYALMTSLSGVFSAIFAVTGHELVGRNYNGATAADNVTPRGPSGQGPYRTSSAPPPADPPKPSPTSARRFLGLAFAALVIVSLVVSFAGCKLFASGSKVPGDIDADYNCIVAQIEAGQTDVMKMVGPGGACFGVELQTAIDIVDTLLASPKFAAAHPAWMQSQLRLSLADARVELAARQAAASRGAGK